MNNLFFTSTAKILLSIFLIIQASTAQSDSFDKTTVEKLLESNSCNPKFSAVTERVEKKVFKLGRKYEEKSADLNEEIEKWVRNTQLTCLERYNLTFFYALNLYRNGSYDASEKLLIKLLDYKIPSENNSKIIQSRLNKVKEKRDQQIKALLIKELKEEEEEARKQADLKAQRKQKAIEAKRLAALEEEARKQADLKAQRKQKAIEAKRLAALEEEARKQADLKAQRKQKQASASKQIKVPTEQKRRQEINRTRAPSSSKENVNQPKVLPTSDESIKTKNCEDKEANQTKTSGRSGIKKRCFEDGTVFSSTNYIEGKKDGLEEVYFKNGKLKNKKYFIRGKLNGYEELYVLENKLDEEGKQVKDWDGNSIKNYYMAFQGSYKEGSKEGKHIYYHPNKQISRVENYKKGVFDGEIKSFFSNGLIKERIVYKKGVYDGTYERYKKDGQPIIKLTYKNGNKNGLEEIYNKETGQLSFRTNFLKDKVAGDFEEYYPDGIIKLSGNYSWGKRAGEWEAYYPDGTLSIRSFYRSGKIEGPLEEYYENGILKKITNNSFGK